MRSRSSAFRYVAVAIGGLATACAPGPTLPPTDLQPIRIGVITSLTGGLSSLGPDWRNAALLAEQEVNAAGGLLDGRPVEFIVADDQTDPEQGLEAAVTLIEEQRVVAIIGAPASSVTLEIAEVTGSFGVPQISCCSTSSDITNAQPEQDRYLFRTVGSDLLQGVVMADYAREELACTALAVFYLDDAYGTPFGMTVTERFSGLGGSIVASVAFVDEQDDYRDEVQLVLAETEAPDCVAIIGFPESAGRIVRDWDVEGGPAIQFIASDGVKDDRFVEAAGASRADGIIGTAPLTAPDSLEYTIFEDHFETVFGSEVVVFGSFQYDAAVLLMLAIEAAGSTDGELVRDALFEVSRPSFIDGERTFGPGEIDQALREIKEGGVIDYVGAGGPVDFDSFGDVTSNYEIWEYDATDDEFEQAAVIQAESIGS